jgi:hypothetical protein
MAHASLIPEIGLLPDHCQEGMHGFTPAITYASPVTPL